MRVSTANVQPSATSDGTVSMAVSTPNVQTFDVAGTVPVDEEPEFPPYENGGIDL